MLTADVGNVDLALIAATFGEVLHRGGVAVSPERRGRFAEAIALAKPATVNDLYWLARVTLVTEREQISVFDRWFDFVFRNISDVSDSRGDAANAAQLAKGEARTDTVRSPRAAIDTNDSTANLRHSPSTDEADPRDGESDDSGDRDLTVLAMMSADERLRALDFSQWTADELLRLRHLLRDVVVRVPQRRSRRTRIHAAGDQIDMRATLRAAQRTGGDPRRLIRRRRRIRSRRVVLLADVSGSMEPYALAYVTFVHGMVRALEAEAFVFATRLTRLTRQLRVKNPSMALTQAMLATPDWSGGTRLGGALGSFNDGWGRRGLARGAIVVVVSDGWSGDGPDIVRREMGRLRRLAHRIIWVNPRVQAPGYQPLVGGMAAALPFVDDFISGHSIRSLQEVADAVGR